MDKIKFDKNSNLPLIIFIVFLVSTFICILIFNVSTLFALDNSTMMSANCVCNHKKCVCNINYREPNNPIYENYTNNYDEIYAENNNVKCEYCNNENNIETFENSTINFTKYKQLKLLPPDHTNQITNILLSGQANIYKNDNTARLELVCNLYEIGGNVYDTVHTIKGKYIAYLYNDKTNQQLTLGDLVRDGDGLYKLNYVSNNIQELSNYNLIRIAYITDNESTTIIEAKL
uniref:Uncharacterized protein n=1 Tax=viral metagenome TaxID=1070528 RepID=A0A6C0CZS3_9ZZZZ